VAWAKNSPQRSENLTPQLAVFVPYSPRRRSNHRGVRHVPARPARPYRTHLPDANNTSDIEQPGGVERRKMRSPGGTGPRVIFPDLAMYAGGPHGRPFCAAGTGRHRGAPSIRTIEGYNNKTEGWYQKYGAPAPLKSTYCERFPMKKGPAHLVQGCLAAVCGGSGARAPWQYRHRHA